MTPVSVTQVLEEVRGHLRRRSGALAFLGVVAVAGGVLALAWLLAGPEGWRPGTALPLLLVAGGGIAALSLVAWVLARLRRWSSEAALSGEVERSAQLPEGSVRSQAELARSLPPGVSGSLARAGEGRLLSRLQGAPGRFSGRPGREAGRHLRVAGAAAAAAVLLVGSLAWMSPDRTRTAWAGLARPGALLKPEPLPPLELHPGTARLPRGEAPGVLVRASGRDSVTLHWRGVGEVRQERTLGVVEGEGGTRLPPLTSEISYWATSPEGARTDVHRLTPVDPSLLTDLVLEVRFPRHTRLPPEVHRGQAPFLVLPQGSEIRVRGGVAGEGDAVLLREEGAGPGEGPVLARFPVDGNGFSGRWVPLRSLVAAWEVEGGQESPRAVLPPPLEVEVMADRPPEVALPLPGRDMDLPLSLRLPLLLEAQDDWGVAWVEVEAALERPEGELEEPVLDRIPTGERQRVMIRPVLDVSEWGLEPGDEVLVRARAADNAPTAQVAETPVYRLRVPSAFRVREMARDRIQEAAGRAEELAERAAREARELRDLAIQARTDAQNPQTGEFQAREELREALEAQEEAARELEELREGLEEARRALGEGREEDAALRERLRELGRLLDEVLDSEARERLRELRERLEGGETPPLREALEEMALDQEELRERLEAVLERLQRSALEAAFEGAEDEVRELAEEQEALTSRLAQAEGAEDQEALAERTEALMERLEALQQRLTEEGSPDAGNRAREAGEDLSRAREAMERAAEAARAGQGEEAAGEGDRAGEEVQEALRQMEEARMEWLAEWEEQVRSALRRAAEDALGLARRQGELRDRIQYAGPELRRRLQVEEAVLIQGLRNLGTAVGLATRQAPEVGRRLSSAIGEAMDAAARTVEGLQGGAQGPGTVPYASSGQALEAMNRVALLALEGMEMVGEQPEGRALDQLMEELEAMAAQQSAVNQEAASLADDPGQEGAEGRMEEVAQAQDAVASAMDELARGPGGERSVGDLEELAREARELARELDEGRLDATTLARQEQLLDRLLSAGRTLEREGDTEEREGTPAGPVERRAVAPLSPDLLQVWGFPLPSQADLEALSPGQRRLVLEYFERMNRRRSGGGNP